MELTFNNFTYKEVRTVDRQGVEVQGIEITGYVEEPKGELHIPSLIDGKPVISIGGGAFEGCKQITGDLVLPKSIIGIGCNAFGHCEGINGRLVLNDGLRVIEISAFYNCCNITGDLIIPNSVVCIQNDAFENCYGFNGYLALSNNLKSIGHFAFCNCCNLTGNLIIPNSVECIHSFAFRYCTGFNGVLSLPDNKTNKVWLEYGSFEFCSGLKEIVDFGSNLVLEDYVFKGCVGLTGEITLPAQYNTPELIKGNSFHLCYNLNINIPNWSSTVSALSDKIDFNSINSSRDLRLCLMNTYVKPYLNPTKIEELSYSISSRTQLDDTLPITELILKSLPLLTKDKNIQNGLCFILFKGLEIGPISFLGTSQDYNLVSPFYTSLVKDKVKLKTYVQTLECLLAYLGVID